MADRSAPRPLSIARQPLDTVGEPKFVPPRPTLVERAENASVRVRSAGEEAYENARKTVLDTIARARRNLRYMTDEKPMQLVIGVAVASFLVGVGLRLWRSRYE